MISTRTRDAAGAREGTGGEARRSQAPAARNAAVKAIEANADRHAANVLPITGKYSARALRHYAPEQRSKAAELAVMIRALSACFKVVAAVLEKCQRQ